MGKRTDLETILIIGSGPIVIGQACEFDYSGTQACRALRSIGYRVVLANSNPATIMTDPDFADATYVEPLTVEVLEKIIIAESPDALLATLGGQTALNLAMELHEAGVLDRHGVELIGANSDAISTAEDRQKFKEAMVEIGLEVPRSGIAHDMDEANRQVEEIGLPVVIRPAYILGGKGTGIAKTDEEFAQTAAAGLNASPISEILIEESIEGWKEFELEVMRDSQDNQVIICGIENFDPMGVHTGDSITVAPIQTLSDPEYQAMRDEAFACLRRVGVETGGSNVQFAVDPETGRRVIIEMNPRVSRSSALASKATGFPIAKIAAMLAVGYTLDEIPNDITKQTPASFEPVIDYVVTKIPRWAFEKLPGTPPVLGTSMQSVGEVMALGRTFCESLQKACRSLEVGQHGLGASAAEQEFTDLGAEELLAQIALPTPDRLFKISAALWLGATVEQVCEATKIDPWFISQIERVSLERRAIAGWESPTDSHSWKRAKRLGFSDAQVGHIRGISQVQARTDRLSAGVRPTYKSVDTCAGEFAAETPYYYSTYEDQDEVARSERPKVLIIGSGPNRIGQGIEFDYCCVHASFSLSEQGYETILVNCNPETVSTDYDTSDRLYFEPITIEDVSNIIDAEQPEKIIVTLGGQTPLKLADSLPSGLIAGTKSDSIAIAEDRERWNSLCGYLGIQQPDGGTASATDEALEVAADIGYPVLIRPSFVLGGRAMEIVYNERELETALAQMSKLSGADAEVSMSEDRPVLIDHFLEGAIEVDVDAIRDHEGEFLLGAVMEHIEEAGVHSGDSSCMLPTQNLDPIVLRDIADQTEQIANALDVRGPINVQFAVRDNRGTPETYVIEANPRASRTLPFVAKATGVQLAKIAARVMCGETIASLRASGVVEAPTVGFTAVKCPVLPFSRFLETDALVGPEMRSTGEVMGIDSDPGLALVKSRIAAGIEVKDSAKPTVFMSLADRDKAMGTVVAAKFIELGYEIVATQGTAKELSVSNIAVRDIVNKLSETNEFVAVDLIENDQIDIVINTPRDRGSRADGAYIRIAANQKGIPLFTTISAAMAMVSGLQAANAQNLSVRSLQSIHNA